MFMVDISCYSLWHKKIISSAKYDYNGEMIKLDPKGLKITTKENLKM